MLRSVTLACVMVAAASSEAPRPHIVMIVADDTGWSNIGFNTGGRVRTPTIDALAADGIMLASHYVYKFCSPSRSSFMSGRLPIHVNQENSATEQRYAGIPLNFTTLPEKLCARAGYPGGGGYACHAVGKWHCGMASTAHTPRGRGFDSFVGFFDFGEDHYTQIRSGAARRRLGAAAAAERNDGPTAEGADDDVFIDDGGGGCSGVDLWRDDAPATGENGTYGDYIYAAAAADAAAAHNASGRAAGAPPLFMYAAFQNLHPPLQVPQAYMDRYANDTDPPAPLTIAGMAAFLDDCVLNLTAALRANAFVTTADARGGAEDAGAEGGGAAGGAARTMYDDTLIVFTPDNGAYLGSGGDSTPYRGGKFSDFSGGVRVAAFVSGGFVPAARRGATARGLLAGADWYATFLALAGVAPAAIVAETAGVTPIDSLDAWPMIVGDVADGPRREIPLSIMPPGVGALRAGEGTGYYVAGEGIVARGHKLLLGPQSHGPFDDGTTMPTCDSLVPPHGARGGGGWTKDEPGVPCDCGSGGCLFDLENDPFETRDLAAAKPALAAALRERLEALRDGVYAPERGGLEQAACDAVGEHGGFWAPWL